MKLAYQHFQKRNYIPGVTPLEYAPRLTSLLGGPEIFIKRDDTLEGGNKARKLEFVLGEALSQGADTLVTCGALQSNHCKATLAFANREGLKCHLILNETIPGTYDPGAGGNNLLFNILGAASIRIVPPGADMNAELAETAELLSRGGKHPYTIPSGASTARGCLGYVCAAKEMLQQADAEEISIDHIVVPSGSGGTHAGLVVGLQESRARIPVTGINVLCGRAEQEQKVSNLAVQTLELLDSSLSGLSLPVRCRDEYVGPGYTVPTRGMIEAVRTAARTESLILDPVYSGKAMAGLIDLVRRGRFKKGENIIFIATGGFPALFEYKDYFLPGNEPEDSNERS